LLPNHCLDLDAWTVRRHWPSAQVGDGSELDPTHAVRAITSAMSARIVRLAETRPIQCTLTAGQDTRVLLACARGALGHTTFVPQEEAGRSVDPPGASRWARRFGRAHVGIKFERPPSAELRDWLFLPGHSVSGSIWRVHRGMRKLDRHSVLMHGTGGEVARG